MCYVHNQWYDISCATLYLLEFNDVPFGQYYTSLRIIFVPSSSGISSLALLILR